MATYLDNAGVTQILTKIKSLLAKKAEITAIPTKVSQLANDRSYQTPDDVTTKIDAKLGELDFDSATSGTAATGTSYYICSLKQENGLVKAERNSFYSEFSANLEIERAKGSVVNSALVSSMIKSAVDKITSFNYEVVSELPPESDGKKGTIYLLRRTDKDYTNLFDEYILVDTFTGSDGIEYMTHYEKIGTTDIDLTPYAKKTEIPTKVSQLSNDSSFATTSGVSSSISTAVNALTKSDSAETGKYVSAVSQKNGVITVTRANLPAVGTADTPISNTTIESIFTQVFG